MSRFAYFIGGSQDLTKRVIADDGPPVISFPKLAPLSLMSKVPATMEVTIETYRRIACHSLGRIVIYMVEAEEGVW